METDQGTIFKRITPDPEKYYRISWFGGVSYSDGKKARPTPIIEVYVCEVKSAPPFYDLKPSSTDTDRYDKIRVPVALLGTLKLGDIWHQNQLYQSATKHYKVCEFRSIASGSPNNRTIVARSKHNDSYWLRTSVHPYHLPFTGAPLEAIEIDKKRSLLIPHMVMIQTFFAPDTFVLAQSFKMGLTLDSVVDTQKSYLNRGSKKAFVHLRKGVLDESHKVCAMLAFDDTFRNAYKAVSKGLAVQKSKNFSTLVPYTKLPMNGSQTLSVVGQWMYDEKNEHWSFLVFQILSASMTPPFTELLYFRDNPGDTNPNADVGDGNGGKGPPKPPEPPKKPTKVDPDSDPNGEYESLTEKLNTNALFPDLFSIPSEKRRQEEHKNTEVNPRNQEAGNPNGVGAGDSGDDDSQGWKGSTLGDVPLAPMQKYTFEQRFSRVELFREVLNELMRSSTSRVSIENTEIYDFPKIQINSRQSTWDNLNYHRGQSFPTTKRARRVLISRLVTKSGQVFYLFEMERKMKLASNGWYEVDDYSLMMLKTNYLSDREIRKLLTLIVRNNGWPTKIGSLTKQSVQHPLNELVFKPEYACRMADLIIKALREP